MSEKYQNKYRISSARMQTWDYSRDAAYFVPICTKDKMRYFGEIEDSIMILSKIGIIADVLWYEMKNRNKIELGEFMVMPNHIHGVIIINGNDAEKSNEPTETEFPSSNAAPPKTIGQKRFQNQGKNSLSSIVGGYKSAVTKHVNRLGIPFDWQSRFHDHIIRNGQSFDNISNYIINNPKNWRDDRFYTSRQGMPCLDKPQNATNIFQFYNGSNTRMKNHGTHYSDKMDGYKTT